MITVNDLAVKQVWQGSAAKFKIVYWIINCRALKAACTENQELCIEGMLEQLCTFLYHLFLVRPKDNTSRKGEKGDQGIRGTNSSVYSTVLLKVFCLNLSCCTGTEKKLCCCQIS